MNLPEDLHKEVKARGLDVDALMADAIRAELRRLEDDAVEQAYEDALIAEGRAKYGDSLTQEEVRAKALFDRLERHLSKKSHVS